MSKTGITVLIIIIILVIGGAVVWSMQSQPITQTQAPMMPVQTTTSTTTTTTTITTPAPVTSTPVAAPKTDNFTIHADDAAADVTTVNVSKGDTVNITFDVSANTTYHGGLDFRSSVLNTGTITPGASKMISFTADASFVFTPYWPSTNIAKPYTISVVVQ